SFNEDQLITFAMMVWSLWRKRNMKLWKNKIETIMQFIHRANNTIQAWRQTPPLHIYLKCNIDAAVFIHDNKVSMGACLRDDKGVFVAAFS
ncbi:replication protein A 70 kDa DNA-binding subunit, partial [Trifolium pratense]